ncbi:MAG: hypothetical protein HY657_08255 [Acidobacteria bacterium]|nr:hypothetical protein [Acidobacteriota bacterium]
MCHEPRYDETSTRLEKTSNQDSGDDGIVVREYRGFRENRPASDTAQLVLPEVLGSSLIGGGMPKELEERVTQLEAQMEHQAERVNDVRDAVSSLRQDMIHRFEQVDRRFEQVHEEMTRRFEQVDRRFEQVDRGFELMDRKMDRHVIWLVGVMTTGFIATMTALTRFVFR